MIIKLTGSNVPVPIQVSVFLFAGVSAGEFQTDFVGLVSNLLKQ